MIERLGCLCLLVLLGAATATSAYAATENYAASECVRRSGGAVAYTFDGAVYNTSATTNALVICHVPHTDFDGFLHTGAIEGGWFDAVDLNASEDLRCRFRGSSLAASGAITRYYGAMSSTTGFGTSRQSRNLSGLGENSRSSYVLACDIPPSTANGNSKVHAYQIRQ